MKTDTKADEASRREDRIFWWNPGGRIHSGGDDETRRVAQSYTWEFIPPREYFRPLWRDVTEAQIYLTRECNLACGYCRLVGNRTLTELDLEGWRTAGRAMVRIGIKTVKILGGEPTVKEWLPELIAYYRKIGLKTALLSNSSFHESLIDRLSAAGLFGYFASVDSLADICRYDEQSRTKSRNGYAMLRRMKQHGIPLLAANTVIHRNNLEEIPELVGRLSNEGFYINLCTVQHTGDPMREFSRVDTGGGSRFRKEDLPRLRTLSETLIALTKRGVRITVPSSYLAGIPRFAIDCSWQCGRLYQLRIDADGGLMLCNEYRTRLAAKYNITLLDKKGWESYQEEWVEERNAAACTGCYWSCFLHAEDNIHRGVEEFSYADGVGR